MKTFFVVIAVAKYKEKILLLKRSGTRHFSPEKWQPVSGFPKEKESAEECALRELKEETGLTGEIKNESSVFEYENKFGHWINLAFLIEVHNTNVNLNPKEHSDFAWILPKDYAEFDCIEGVKFDLELLELVS
ncbi:NUDIX hydrolase [Candidatus Dojkabacteria bacterium]|nr:NUDIX hydrolase [Candidatus Dojkabacteria bacterium]